MRCLTVAGLIVVVLSGAPATARNLPWCLVDATAMATISCAFTSFEQCLAEARPGNTGYCMPNPYAGPPGPAPRRKPRRHHR